MKTKLKAKDVKLTSKEAAYWAELITASERGIEDLEKQLKFQKFVCLNATKNWEMEQAAFTGEPVCWSEQQAQRA